MGAPHDQGFKSSSNSTRHSKEDALDDVIYERLLRSTRDLSNHYCLQTEFVLLVAGRLGLRRGEIGHLTDDWIDWRQRRIQIPAYEPCSNGHEGVTCGYCKQLAEQEVNHNEDVQMEEAVAKRWHPKTPSAARDVPFGPMPRAEAIIEEFFDRYDEWPHSCQAVNRRVNTVAELTPDVEVERVFPHALRATAATFWAGRGINVFALQQLMGWADLQTARKYIASNPDNTERALHFAQSG